MSLPLAALQSDWLCFTYAHSLPAAQAAAWAEWLTPAFACQLMELSAIKPTAADPSLPPPSSGQVHQGWPRRPRRLLLDCAGEHTCMLRRAAVGARHACWLRWCLLTLHMHFSGNPSQLAHMLRGPIHLHTVTTTMCLPSPHCSGSSLTTPTSRTLRSSRMPTCWCCPPMHASLRMRPSSASRGALWNVNLELNRSRGAFECEP